MFFALSSETDRVKSSARSEPSSEGKRTPKKSGKSENGHPEKNVRARNTFFALLSETDRVKFSARSEPSSGGKRPSKKLGKSEK